MRFRYHAPFAEVSSGWQENAQALASLCESAAVHFGAWPLPEALDGLALLHNADSQAQTLAAVAEPLKKLKETFGYSSEDIVGLSPETPNLESLLAAFKREHHHSDDEVRVILHGTGIFGLLPKDAPAFELELTAGDWIVLPAFTRHWFTLAENKTALALRVFKSNPQWQAIYEPIEA